jgi:hypothetical protein
MTFRKENGSINWGNFTLSIMILLLTVFGIIYGAGATLATKQDVRELKQERIAWSTEHERQNREDMREIREMFLTIQAGMEKNKPHK